MHCYHAVAAAIAQRLLVGVGQFGRSGRRGGGVALVEVVGDLVHAITQIDPIEQDMQWGDADGPLFE